MDEHIIGVPLMTHYIGSHLSCWLQQIYSSWAHMHKRFGIHEKHPTPAPELVQLYGKDD